MPTLEGLKDLLKAILTAQQLTSQRIAEYQQLVWNASGIQGANTKQEEILRELALDLDFFEPNEAERAMEPSYFGEERARTEIQRALQAVDEWRNA